ncbi:hypothetical protein EG68_04768 [Paragonimus skrjabini miyazakii]|uniref:Mothers against decapentaplegic homolog n=1 Tax=Paragonimus skrjabini miyazakii TaxID=59628 RepID=A0A8S9YZ30_9TREM|nr:hypothetical protein EG68_04768 [Paragonimus skrjabini miyazakii]
MCSIEFPLFFIIRLLLKSLKPDCIFALASVLRSPSSLTNASFPKNDVDNGDCVFVESAQKYLLKACDKMQENGPSSFASDFTLSLFDPPRCENSSNGCCLSRSCHKSFIPTSRNFVFTCELSTETDFSGRSPIEQLFSKGFSPKIRYTYLYVDAVFAICKAYRWPDLKPGEWLRRLPACRASSNDLPGGLCINPKHWSRVILLDHSDSESLSGGNLTSDSSFETEPDLLCVGISATQRARDSLFSLNKSILETQSRENPNMQPVCRNVPSLRSDSTNIPPVPNPGDQFNLPVATDSYFYSLKEAGSELINVDTAGNSSNLISFPIHQTDPNCQLTFNNTGCHTTCTELTDSSLNSSHMVSSDSPVYGSLPASSCASSSASTSEIDELGPRKMADRASFLEFTKQDVTPINPKSRSWASLSYWEASRHIAHSWFKLSDPVVQVVYDNKVHYTHSEVKNTGTRRSSQNVHRSRGITYVCLSSLVAQPDNQFHNESIDQLELSCTSCTTSSSASGSPTTGRHHFSPIYNVSGQQCTHSFRLNSGPPSLCERKVSWRQCYRLGNHGLILTLTPGGRVWLDNKTTLSDLPIFVSSTCLSGKHNTSTGWPVYRVPAGCSILVFDQLIYQQKQFKSQASHTMTHVPDKLDELYCQPSSSNLLHFPVVHISLGKGWGPSYHRPDITHCPARLELWINVHNLSKQAKQ